MIDHRELQTVALIAYACRPGRGSEPGVGWHLFRAAVRATHASGQRLLLVTQEDLLPSIFESVDDVMDFDVLPVHIPRPLRFPRERAMRLHYCIWVAFAGVALRRRAMSGQIQVAHHTTYATASLPTPLWFLPPTVVRLLGPVGGRGSNTLSAGRRVRHRLSRLVSWGIEEFTLQRADLVLAQNPRFAQRATRSDTRKPVILEPNPTVELAEIRALGPALPHEPDADLRVIAVGRLIPRKRHHLTAAAMTHLPDATLEIVGEGPQRKELEQLCLTLGVQDRVTFTGELSHSDTLRRISISDVLILPSNNESAGWVVAEAATLGVPSVVVEGVGAEGVVSLSRMGRIVSEADAQDAERLAAAIKSAARPSSTCSLRWLDRRWPALLQLLYAGRIPLSGEQKVTTSGG